jgi:hypothetical protein
MKFLKVLKFYENLYFFFNFEILKFLEIFELKIFFLYTLDILYEIFEIL